MPLYGERKNQYMRQYRIDHLEEMRRRDREKYKEHRERIRKRTKECKLEVKKEVLTHYGNDILACVTCGEDRLSCLSIDHINGGGTYHREHFGLYGSKMYSWLKRNNYPVGYQTLCMNCQWVKREENNEYPSAKSLCLDFPLLF